MASLVATSACVVRPTHTAGTRRSKAASRATTSSSLPKSAAMSGLHNAGSAPAFLGAKPAQLSAGLAIGRRGGGAGCRGVATMGLFGLGLPELVVIGGVAAVLFGPSKLPELGKSLGKTVKSFQEGATEFQEELKKGREEEEAAAAAAAPKPIEEKKEEEKKAE